MDVISCRSDNDLLYRYESEDRRRRPRKKGKSNKTRKGQEIKGHM